MPRMPVSLAAPAPYRRLAAPLAAIVRAVLAGERRRAGEIGVRLADDAELRELNRRWRGIDRATDVISFAYDEHEPDAETRPVTGDLVISLDRVVAQAKRFHVTKGVELARLVVHGALHLCGHDHVRPGERAAMRAREEAALRAVRAQAKRMDREWPRGRARGVPAAVATALLVLSLAPSEAPARCVPEDLVRAISEAQVARVLSTDGCDPARAARFDSTGRTFCGCRGRERVVLSGEEAAGLRRAFGSEEAYACDRVPLNLGWGTGRHGAVAIEFGSAARRVEMLLVLPAGTIVARLADGPRYALRGSPECAERWREFVEACARERSRSPWTFLDGLLGRWEHGAAGLAAGSAEADSNCLSPPAAAGEYEDGLGLPEPVTRVPPDSLARDATDARGAAAKVIVQVLVCRDGSVHPDVRVQQGAPEAAERAVAAVRRWAFRPALSRGRPVPAWVAIPIEVPVGR